MAITNTRTVQRCEVYPAMNDESNPSLMVVYQHIFDDTEDDSLPASSTVVKHLHRYILNVDAAGEETSTATDVTGEDQLVQDICGALWS
jgi:hypothetical protein